MNAQQRQQTQQAGTSASLAEAERHGDASSGISGNGLVEVAPYPGGLPETPSAASPANNNPQAAADWARESGHADLTPTLPGIGPPMEAPPATQRGVAPPGPGNVTPPAAEAPPATLRGVAPPGAGNVKPSGGR
jgi:hypothetical protein